LVVPRRRALELNELEWWSNWTKLKWLGRNAYVLSARGFPEFFFNRGGLIECRSFSSSIGRLETSLHGLGVKPVVTVYETCHDARSRLVRKGYRTKDTMTVLKSTSRYSSGLDNDVEIGPASSARQWSRAYLLSFYGELGLLTAVANVVRRVMSSDSATLLEARRDRKVAGVLAIYRTPRLAGVYCVGTVPGFRRRGIAGMLLGRANEIASSERRTLILQTLTSDKAEQFYLKRGFTPLYRKVLMEKN